MTGWDIVLLVAALLWVCVGLPWACFRIADDMHRRSTERIDRAIWGPNGMPSHMKWTREL